MSRVKITWINSITVGVTKHIIYRDDIEIGQVVVANPSIYYDESPISGVTHKYEVQSVDPNGVSVDEQVTVNVISLFIPAEPPVVEPNVLHPQLSNFRVFDSQKSRIYFDSNMVISGTDAVGFHVAYKSIVGLHINPGEITDHYFTVNTPFTFWDNNTIRLGEITDSSDQQTGLNNFTLEYIENNIPEPDAPSAE